MRFVALLVLLTTPYVALASGRLGGTVLNLGVGARAESMGGAFVAVADDVSALYWNPSGIGQLEQSRFSATHTEWIGGLRYEWIGFVQPVSDVAALGVSGALLTGADEPHTVLASSGFEQRGAFNYSTRHVQFTLASKELGRFRVGGALEIVREGLDFTETTAEVPTTEADASALHLGGLYDSPVDGLKVGAALRNLGSDVTLFDAPAPLPRTLLLGVAYERLIEAVGPEAEPIELPTDTPADPQPTSDALTLAADLRFMREEGPVLRAGAEYGFHNGFSIRAGYRGDGPFDLVSKLSGGLGFAGQSYEIDYGFVPMGDLGNVHRVSFTLLFR